MKDILTDVITQDNRRYKKCHDCNMSIIGECWYRFLSERGISKSVPVCEKCINTYNMPYGGYYYGKGDEEVIVPFKSKEDADKYNAGIGGNEND